MISHPIASTHTARHEEHLYRQDTGVRHLIGCLGQIENFSPDSIVMNSIVYLVRRLLIQRTN